MTIPTPEYHNYESYLIRKQKLAEIRACGIEPFPQKYLNTKSISTILQECEGKELAHSEEAGEGKTEAVCITGRLITFRGMGKNAFAHVQEGADQIQVMFNRDLTTVTGYEPTAELNHLKFIEKKLDFGDIIGIEGHLFKTQRGEVTIFAKKVTLLCKALLPLPDKHSGLVDKEAIYRKRWLDLISNPESLNRFQKRSKIVHTIRKYMAEAGFDEVETPVLQNVYGGAAAEPFTTHLNSLKQDMFLRISLEIPLKKLIIGGMQRVFEIGKVFRNEGIDRTHNPEFTMLEAYATGWDYFDMMTFTENLFKTVALEVFGDTKLRLTPEGESTAMVIDFAKPWIRISMKDAIKKYAGYDVDTMSDSDMKVLLLKEAKVDPKEVEPATRGAMIAMIFEEFAEKFLDEPHHILDHPIETTPLCKLHRDPTLRKEGFVERFESFIMRREMCNSYTELNDPELQRDLLVDQAKKKEAGDLEASPLDEEFLEAICQGMPPTGGVGIGIDRLVMLFTNAESIRDVLLFPLMKPE